ncbi:MAG: DUF1326 domain-containing protein [Geminicoccaceae bacterium]
MAYSLEGNILEVCDCNVLCPCWIGEDPDNGTCRSALAYNITRGDIDGIDVSGLNVAVAVFIPGNVLKGGWRAVRFIDNRASPEQEAALLAVFRGQKGGPLKDLAGLVGEEVAVHRAPIRYEVREGKGKLTIGDGVLAEMEPYRGPSGEVTKLVESIFSTIPGSPAYVAKASRFRMHQPEIGVDLELAGHNAIQGEFRLQA